MVGNYPNTWVTYPSALVDGLKSGELGVVNIGIDGHARPLTIFADGNFFAANETRAWISHFKHPICYKQCDSKGISCCHNHHRFV